MSMDVASVPRQCRGWPEGHACPVSLEAGIFCQGCLLARQRAMAEGLPGDMTPVGIVLEDFNAPKLLCRCGGDPEAPHHTDSLLHLKWSWQVQAEAGTLKPTIVGKPLTRSQRNRLGLGPANRE